MKKLLCIVILLAAFAGAQTTRNQVNLGSVNGTTLQQMTAGLDSTGAGVLATGTLCQLDDVGTAPVTENNFASVRCSPRRALYVEGLVAAGVAVSGNPVMAGWKDTSGFAQFPPCSMQGGFCVPISVFSNAASVVGGGSYNSMGLPIDHGGTSAPQGAVAMSLENSNGTYTIVASNGIYRARVVSATNTQQQFTIDLKDASQALSIHAACSAGTAALTVEVGSDNTNWITIDSLTAAQFQAKAYTSAAPVGASAAAASAGPLSPFAFRYLRITEATCGVGNTSTVTLGAK